MMDRVTQKQLVGLFGDNWRVVLTAYTGWLDLQPNRQFRSFEQWWEGALTYQQRQGFLKP